MDDTDLGWNSRVFRRFATLAEILTTDFDVAELSQLLISACMELLDLAAAGIVLADSDGVLRVMATSDAGVRDLEIYELVNQEGPCLDCYRSGRAVCVAGIDEIERRWPAFALQFRLRGYGATYALPLRLGGQAIGALNLVAGAGSELLEDDLEAARVLADVATIAVVQHRTLTRREEVASQLQIALDSRVAIEQAKGILAERAQLDVAEAFRLLRHYARHQGIRLAVVAGAVVAGTLDVAVVVNEAKVMGSADEVKRNGPIDRPPPSDGPIPPRNCIGPPADPVTIDPAVTTLDPIDVEKG